MARNTTLAPPEETQVDDARPGMDTAAPVAAPPRVPEKEPLHKTELFAEALLEFSPTRPPRTTGKLLISVFIHVLVLAVLLLIPLYYTEAIDLRQFTATLLVAPPPPPPPPPPAAPAVARTPRRPQRVFTAGGKLLAPTAIPEKVAILKEEALPPDPGIGYGVVGGVPGGVPGGQVGGVIGGILGGGPRTQVPPPPPAARPAEPIRVGGRVMPPKLIRRVEPVYPPLALQARVQGDVIIDAVIDTEGNVVEMQLVSGHPLLVQAAMDALRRWRYQPTYLNDQPVPVKLLVTIRFALH